MSDTAQPVQQPRRSNELVIFLVVGVALLGLFWLFGGAGERPLQRTAVGMQGLVNWLRANDVETIQFDGGGRLVQGNVALRILPLHDTDLEKGRERPTTRIEVIEETSQRDLPKWAYTRKTRMLPTLVVLPKWRAGVHLLGAAHRDLLIPDAEIDRLLGQIGIDGGKIQRSAAGWEESRPRSDGDRLARPIGLMHAQTLRLPGDSVPMIGDRDRVILAECPVNGDDEQKKGDDRNQTHFWVLSDPDLLSNHGLKWAGNGAFALDVVKRFDLAHPVVVDLTNRVWTVSEDWEARQHERTWEDFARMFRWPFTMIWIAFFALGGLVLWRAVKRYGPLARFYAEEPGASKTVAIDAKARLLRMANHDGALLGNHIQARLAHLASELLGPHRAADTAPLEALTRLIGRRNPELANELGAAASVPMGGPESSADIIRRLDRFETAYEKVTHEFGRTTESR